MIVVNGSKTRWHVGRRGTLMQCSAATASGCPLGGDVVAADNAADAHGAYEQYVKSNVAPDQHFFANPLKRKKINTQIAAAAAASGDTVGEYIAKNGTYHVSRGAFRYKTVKTSAAAHKQSKTVNSQAMPNVNHRSMRRRSSTKNKLKNALIGRRGLLRKPAVIGAGGLALTAAPIIAPVGALVLAGTALHVFVKSRGRSNRLMRALW